MPRWKGGEVARTRTVATVGAVAAVLAAGAAWEAVRRRDVARLADDPHRGVLTAVPPGRPTSLSRDDGTVLHVRVSDAVVEPRATVVLAHGWGMGLRFWIHQIRDLLPDHVVIAYDQRGHNGSSEVGDDGFDIDALGADLAAVVDRFAPPGLPVVLVGHSLGGMSVLSSGTEPGIVDRVGGAVLLDTGAGDLTKGLFRGLGVLETVASDVGARAMRARVPIPRRTTPISSRLVRAGALNPSASPSAVALTEQLFLDMPVDVRAGLGITLADLDLSHALPRWTVPTTVVVGSRDRLTPPSHAQRLVRELPDAELVVVPGGGHQTPLEEPERITRLIRARVSATLAAYEPEDAAAGDRAPGAA
jgi:pimeloyl-ACP methyl ester carboxylesterase